MGLLELSRFALYADLGIAFGVPVAALLTQAAVFPVRRLITGAVLAGLPLSIIVYLLTVAEMAGTGLTDLDWQLAGELVAGTAVGRAFLVRTSALVVMAALCLGSPARTGWQLAPGALALASLAWSGHAAAGEGAMALPRLAADVAHLLSAAIWFGALVLFFASLRSPAADLKAAARPLERFAGLGSILVGLLVLTGLVNLGFIAPPDTWSGLLATTYGTLLAVKLGLFAAMLTLATLNRFVLVPGLRGQGAASALTRLQLAIGTEFCAALAILFIVARLGLLDPGT